MPDFRKERFLTVKDEDHRGCFIRDRDRLMFSYAVQRLAGVTQLASPSEGDVVHNRLTHTLEMAQLGRRLSEMLLDKNKDILADYKKEIDPDVVETACLAHDIGHPPFGHTGEEALNTILRDSGNTNDGFEGNAQSFRIVTTLEPYRVDLLGLNLTRASLLAMVKYPKYYTEESNKWGWYKTENKIVSWIGGQEIWNSSRLEVSIMDMADDIAYGSHDLLDFYRAKLIPLYTLINNEEILIECIDNFLKNKKNKRFLSYKDSISSFLRKKIYISREYDGSLTARAEIRKVSSDLIKYFRDGLTIIYDDKTLKVRLDEEKESQLSFIKYLTQNYAQGNTQIACQRIGFRKIVTTIFSELVDDLENNRNKSILDLNNELFEKIKKYNPESSKEISNERSVSDLICHLTDKQVIRLYQRITGISTSTFINTME